MNDHEPSVAPDEIRLRKLLDTALSGAQTDAEGAELRRLLDERPELRPAVVEQLRVHSLLMWEMAQPAGCFPALIDAAGESACVAPSPRPTPSGRWASSGWASSGWASSGWAAVLAAACAGVMLWSGLYRWSEPTPIGQITPGADLRLASNTTAVTGDDALTPGVLEIEAGSLAITFVSGVELEIAGPARCDVVSGMLVRLDHGQATAEVPRWARGFTVETPDVGVVDLGTRFGVARALDGKTDVVVFEGKVDVKSLASNKSAPFERRLTQGEAARIDQDGAMERIFQVHGDWTGNGWSTDRRTAEQSLIAAVWDNLWASKSVSYYQVLPGGLGEDVPAYVNHPHQWNGVDEAGLPDFLRGADYVRTVNDFRYMGYLAIQIELAADADVYVFYDRRSPLPAWLVDDYEDTGAEIGLDEDAWFGNPQFSVESGAGRSIDNTFSVWRRACHAGEVITLGSMNEGSEARAMYGVAAKAR